MPRLSKFERLHSPEDRRVALTIVSFIYSPLVLMLGAAATLGLA